MPAVRLGFQTNDSWAASNGPSTRLALAESTRFLLDPAYGPATIGEQIPASVFAVQWPEMLVLPMATSRPGGCGHGRAPVLADVVLRHLALRASRKKDLPSVRVPVVDDSVTTTGQDGQQACELFALATTARG